MTTASPHCPMAAKRGARGGATPYAARDLFERAMRVEWARDLFDDKLACECGLIAPMDSVIYEEVERAARCAGVPMVDQLIVGDDYGMGLCPAFCGDNIDIRLYVGAGFLAVMDRGAFRAVLAHEMAHIARGDVFINALSALCAYAVHHAERNVWRWPFVGALAAIPLDVVWRAIARAHKRRRHDQEFAADAEAALKTSPEDLARALTLSAVCRAMGRFPIDVLERIARDDLEIASDDHPSGMARIEALGVPISTPVLIGPSMVELDPWLARFDQGGGRTRRAA